MNVKNELILQGRQVRRKDVEFIKELLRENPNWNRTRLSKELCKWWNWRKENGQLKDMACRSFLLKLENRGYIKLPPALHSGNNKYRNCRIEPVLHSKKPIEGVLKQFYPIQIKVVERGYDLKFFKYFISQYHYLGWSGTVGENLKYLIFDRLERPLGCMMFGAAAWKVQPRDDYIGWEPYIRKRNLSLIANNNRFLLLPWVSIRHLASHILGIVSRRIGEDWQKKYNHPIYLLETFVERDRFKGTCYKAANWIYVGDTQGRGKLDVKMEYALAVKSIWLYPLDPLFRKRLCD